MDEGGAVAGEGNGKGRSCDREVGRTVRGRGKFLGVYCINTEAGSGTVGRGKDKKKRVRVEGKGRGRGTWGEGSAHTDANM